MKKFIKENWFKLCIVIFMIVISLIFCQYQISKIQLIEEKQTNEYFINKRKFGLLLEQSIQKEERLKREEEKLEIKSDRLARCIDNAEVNYWSYMDLNGTSKDEDGVIRAPQYIWDKAKENKHKDEETCFELYK